MTAIQSQISTHQTEGGQIVGRIGQIEQRLGQGRSEQAMAWIGQMQQEVQGVRKLVERNEEEYRIGMVQEGLKLGVLGHQCEERTQLVKADMLALNRAQLDREREFERRLNVMEDRFGKLELEHQKTQTQWQAQIKNDQDVVAHLEARVDYLQRLPLVSQDTHPNLSPAQIEAVNGIIAKLTTQEALVRELGERLDGMLTQGAEWKQGVDLWKSQVEQGQQALTLKVE